MKKNKILICLLILISIILCIPSVIYLINYKTVDGFNSYFSFTLQRVADPERGLIDGKVFIGLFLIFSILYFMILKRSNMIFKSTKQIFILIVIISLFFMIILPFLSSDIYYYIGSAWLDFKYGENPYYTSVEKLQESGVNDEILDNTGYWKATTSVYGPLWNYSAKILVSFSFGNVTIALFAFKIASFLIHIINTCIIYKITKSRKCVLLYGLNPLVLIEFLSNVHNDIYLILFLLLSLYFLKKKKIFYTIILLALSISIKYSTALIVPFILIYCFRKCDVGKKFLLCLTSGIGIIALVVLLYLPYYRDLSIFTNMLVQGTKYSQSIMAYIMKNGDINIFRSLTELSIPIFMIIYITMLIILLFKRNIKLSNLIRNYNSIMLVFIFIILTNFQRWYVLWLMPTIIWQSKNMRKFILYLTITAIIPSLDYFRVGFDLYYLGIAYSISMLIMSSVLVFIDILINKYRKSKNQKERKCQN